jgi:hypothetical protein
MDPVHLGPGGPADAVARGLDAVARAGRSDPAGAAAWLRELARRVRRAGRDRRRGLDRRRTAPPGRCGTERRSGGDRRTGERRGLG